MTGIEHERYRFRRLDEVRHKVEALGLHLEFDEDLSPLRQRVVVGSSETPNALVIHPMTLQLSHPASHPLSHPAAHPLPRV